MTRIVTLDVFADRRLCGNPLAVVPDARGLDPALFQPLARELNLSETVFILPPDEAEAAARLRIFTPARKLGLAGHPLVGAALLLWRDGTPWGEPLPRAFRLATGARLVAVEIRGGFATIGTRPEEDLPSAWVRAPRPLATGPMRSPSEAGALAGRSPSDIRGQPLYAGVGTSFLLAETGPEALGRAAPSWPAFRAEAERLAAEGAETLSALFLHARTGGSGTACRIAARMFAPLDGIAEDPATGSAAAALGALLHARAGLRWLDIGEGEAMGRPSRIRVEAGADGVRIGGTAVPVIEGRLSC